MISFTCNKLTKIQNFRLELVLTYESLHRSRQKQYCFPYNSLDEKWPKTTQAILRCTNTLGRVVYIIHITQQLMLVLVSNFVYSTI